MKITVEKYILLPGKCMHRYAEWRLGHRSRCQIQLRGCKMNCGLMFTPFQSQVAPASGRSSSGVQCTQSDCAGIDIIG
jgi:hypothetical protein